jgi:hypothetical protein
MSTDNVFPLHPTPEHASDETVNEYWELAVALMNAELLFVKPIPVNLPEIGTSKRRDMVFDLVPVGHDMGYRCFDGGKHDSESAFDSGEFGDGKTQDEAYMAWLCCVDEAEPKPRAGRVIHSSQFEAPTYIDDRDENFDADLEDPRE